MICSFHEILIIDRLAFTLIRQQTPIMRIESHWYPASIFSALTTRRSRVDRRHRQNRGNHPGAVGAPRALDAYINGEVLDRSPR
jgi:hypothetical protein